MDEELSARASEFRHTTYSPRIHEWADLWQVSVVVLPSLHVLAAEQNVNVDGHAVYKVRTQEGRIVLSLC